MAKPVEVRRSVLSPRARGDPEIGDHRVPLDQEDVFGHDVAVDDSLPVGEVESVGDLQGNPAGLIHREDARALEAIAERLTGGEGHGVPAWWSLGGRRFPGIEHWEDQGVGQLGGDVDLSAEPVGTEGGCEVGVEDFDGDGAVLSQIEGPVDGGHPAGAEPTP
jgi:hypothetical protein